MEAGQESSSARGHTQADTTATRRLAGPSATRGHTQADTTATRRLAGPSATPSMDVSSQTGDAAFDWQEECYLKLQSMKDCYFAELVECYQWAVIKLRQEELMSTELRGKMITFKLMLTRLLNLLAISKTAITHGVVSHLPFCEKRIVNIVSACRAQKLAIQAQGGQHLSVANTRPTLQHSPDVSQIRLPSYVQGSGILLPLSDGSIIVNSLDHSGKWLMTPEGSSNVNHEGHRMSPIGSSAKKLKVDGMVVQEEPGSSGKPKTKEPNFNCPICLCTVISPVSTLCGHLFCETCLKTAMQRKKECPICRTKLTKKKIHRLFFSASE